MPTCRGYGNSLTQYSARSRTAFKTDRSTPRQTGTSLLLSEVGSTAAGLLGLPGSQGTMARGSAWAERPGTVGGCTGLLNPAPASVNQILQASFCILPATRCRKVVNRAVALIAGFSR